MGWREALSGKYHEVLGEDVGHSLSTRLLQESWGPSPSQGHGGSERNTEKCRHETETSCSP